jgi:hypothetical protein
MMAAEDLRADRAALLSGDHEPQTFASVHSPDLRRTCEPPTAESLIASMNAARDTILRLTTEMDQARAVAGVSVAMLEVILSTDFEVLENVIATHPNPCEWVREQGRLMRADDDAALAAANAACEIMRGRTESAEDRALARGVALDRARTFIYAYRDPTDWYAMLAEDSRVDPALLHDAAPPDTPIAERTCDACGCGPSCERSRRRVCENSGTRREWVPLSFKQMQARKLGPWADEPEAATGNGCEQR